MSCILPASGNYPHDFRGIPGEDDPDRSWVRMKLSLTEWSDDNGTLVELPVEVTFWITDDDLDDEIDIEAVTVTPDGRRSHPAGERITREVAEYVTSTFTFNELRKEGVSA